MAKGKSTKAIVAPASGSGRHEPAAQQAPQVPAVGDNLSGARSGSGYGGSAGDSATSSAGAGK